MADDNSVEDISGARKKKRGGLVLGLILALAGGGAGFGFTSGMIPLGGGGRGGPESIGAEMAFVPVEPMTVSIGGANDRRFLRFRAELEVDSDRKPEVEKVMPRVVDVLNTYLQSLSLGDVEDPSSLLTLRSQMRRRIELVVGGGVRDLLIMEFVVN